MNHEPEKVNSTFTFHISKCHLQNVSDSFKSKSADFWKKRHFREKWMFFPKSFIEVKNDWTWANYQIGQKWPNFVKITKLVKMAKVGNFW